MNLHSALTRLAAAVALAALSTVSAQAAPTPIAYNTSSLAGFAPTLFQSYATSGNAGTVTTSVVSHYLAPAGVADGAPYVYASPTDGRIDVRDINASTFSFLWGSPDGGNLVTYHTSLGDFAYSGSRLTADFGIGIDGNPAVSPVFTAALRDGGLIRSVTFTSDNVAFEVDGVRRVPEPGSIALVTAALGALGWTGRRRRA